MAGNAPHPADVATRDLVDLFTAGQARLEGIIHSGLRRGLDPSRIGTGGQRAGDASAAYRTRQLIQAQGILSELRRVTSLAAPVAIRRTYSAGMLAVSTSLGDSLVLGGEFGRVHLGAVQALSANLEGSLHAAVDQAGDNVAAVFARADALEGALRGDSTPGGRSLAFVGRRVNDPYRAAALRSVGAGVIAGDTRKEVSASLAERLIREGTTDALTGFVDRSGRRWTLSAYTAMVARTTTREAMTRGTINRMREGGLDLVHITHHEHSPDVCSPYDGRVFSLAGTDPRYPRLERLPPFHPNCRHVIGPAKTNLDDFERELAEAVGTPPAKPMPPTPKPRRPKGAAAIEKKLAKAERARALEAKADQYAVRANDPDQEARLRGFVTKGADVTDRDRSLIDAIEGLAADPSHPIALANEAIAQATDAARLRALADDLAAHPQLVEDVAAGRVVIESPGTPAVKAHLADLAQVPANVRKLVSDAGTKLYLSDKNAPDTDDLGRLRGVRPRGWPPGATWDTVPGLYDHGNNLVAAGAGGRHGSVSLLIHEFGHALDAASGAAGGSRSSAFRDLHAVIYNRLPSYLQQGGPRGDAGASELWAEGLAQVVKDERRAEAAYGPEFVAYMKRVALGIGVV